MVFRRARCVVVVHKSTLPRRSGTKSLGISKEEIEMPKECFHGCLATLFAAICLASALQAADQAAGKPPAVGQKAPEFQLNNLDGKPVGLSDATKNGPAVVVVLRGYPGYQCPVCTKQFGELIGKAKGFAEQKATVIFIYPGPANDLDKHAREFIGGKNFPEQFRFVIDPDYKFTELYRLRWNAPNETAYPATFVVDSKGIVRFAKVSQSHGGRASSGEILDALGKIEK
jgi:thioredoxin-dependent peroxiredoxin